VNKASFWGPLRTEGIVYESLLTMANLCALREQDPYPLGRVYRVYVHEYKFMVFHLNIWKIFYLVILYKFII
jgi:hypothetical protein